MSNSVAVQVVRHGDGWVGEVTVEQGAQKTSHRVGVSRSEVARWGRGDCEADVADLVRRSFDFLLERESATSILRRFELSDIRRYFPEFDQEFRR